MPADGSGLLCLFERGKLWNPALEKYLMSEKLQILCHNKKYN